MHIGLHSLAPYFIYYGAIAAFLLSIFWKPQIGLYFLVPLLPMQTARYWIHTFLFGEKLVDILLLGVLIGLLVRKERPIFVFSPINKVILIFIGFIYLSLWQGAFYLGGDLPISVQDPRFSDWKNYVEMLVLFFIAAAAIRTKRQMYLVIGLMCLSVLLVNRDYYSTVGSRNFSQFSYELRDAGALGYAGENGMGAFQAEFAIFLIALAVCARKLVLKLGLCAIALTSIYSLELTLSRGSYLGFLVGIFIIGLIKERKLLIVLLVILATWRAFVPNAVTQRVEMTYSDKEGLDSSAGERVGLWQDALQIITQNPIVGITGTGFDTYQFMERHTGYKDTHNYYVKVFLELGIVGFLVFLFLLRVVWKTSLRLFREAKDPFLGALGCALVAMLGCTIVVNFFGDRWSYLQVNGFLWVLLGFMSRGLLMIKEQEQESIAEEAEIPLSMSSAPEAFLG
jgi:putative inorganic carbon (hco3(-)) transporter